jgi:hypothetical protein
VPCSTSSASLGGRRRLAVGGETWKRSRSSTTIRTQRTSAIW